MTIILKKGTRYYYEINLDFENIHRNSYTKNEFAYLKAFKTLGKVA